MKDTEKMDGLRTEYMTTLAEIAGMAVEKINKRIADSCNKLRAIEQRAKGDRGLPRLHPQPFLFFQKRAFHFALRDIESFGNSRLHCRRIAAILCTVFFPIKGAF